jgi:ribosome biogenesis GTPase A
MLANVDDQSAAGSGSDWAGWKPPPGFAVWEKDDDPAANEAEAAARPALSVGLGGSERRELRRERPFDSNPLQAVLEMPRGYCTGCGVRFQSSAELAPGYVPPSVLEARLAADDDIIIDSTKEPLIGKPKKMRPVTCQRCHALRYQNRLPADTLRVGGGGAIDDPDAPGHAELSPAHFRALLRSLRNRRCVIVCLVDLFDFHGSLVPELSTIVGEGNPLMLVANKVDLIPKGVQPAAIERWVRSECRRASLPPLHFLDMVSARTGEGMPQFLARLEKLMTQKRMDAYVLGAANAGKSSLLNYILEHSSRSQRVVGGRVGKAGGGKGEGDEAPTLTTSHLPGTTLGFVKAALLGGRQAIYDTPGLILPNQLTTLLTTEELADVVPKKRGQHVSLRMGEGQSLLLGGLARVHMRSGRPFLFTLYLANAVAIHPTRTDKVDDVLAKHVGGMLTPPASAERLAALGEFEEHEVKIQGRGWNEVAVDLVLPGLGWIAVTGAGECTVGVSLPRPVRVVTREPLLPEESWKKSASKFTGSKIIDGKGNTKRPARART